MGRFFKLIPATLAVLIAFTQTSMASPIRLMIKLEGRISPGASVGIVQIHPCSFDVEKAYFCVAGTNEMLVASKVLWAENNQPVKLLFDNSAHESTYYVLVADKPFRQAPGSVPRAGIVLETRQYSGARISSAQSFSQAWNTSEPVLGRSVVPRVFDGINRHGAPENYISQYTGYFMADTTGDYEFATVSDDVSYILVDDVTVVELSRPVGAQRGRWLRPKGTTYLRAGRHKLEYYYVRGRGRPCAAVAWKPPDREHLAIMEPAAFLPIAQFGVTKQSFPPGGLYFTWETRDSSKAGDPVMLRFKACGVTRKKTEITWRFDDGTSDEGKTVDHLFPSPGLRKVTMATRSHKDGEKTQACRVRVEPNWGTENSRYGRARAEYITDLMKRDMSVMPTADIAYLMEWAGNVDHSGLLAKLATACSLRKKELADKYGRTVYLLGLYYIRPSVRNYPGAEDCFKLATGAPSQDADTKKAATLELAHLYIHCLDRAQDGLDLLSDIEPGSAGHRYDPHVLKADALLALGRVEEARSRYTVLDRSKNWSTRRWEIQRRSMFESARSMILGGMFDDAADILKRIETSSPVEKIYGETGFMMVDVHLGRKEYRYALARCRILRETMSAHRNQSMVLLKMSEAYTGLGEEKKAQEIMEELFKKYPYTEAAALAREKYR